MLNIAICDDEKAVTGTLDSLLLEIGRECGIKICNDIFFSGEKLCELISTEKKHYDLIFLDIELQKMDGVVVGKFIRNTIKDESTQIVYISSKESYALKLFKTRPLDFIIKPFQKEDIKETVITALKILHKGKRFFEYSKGQTLVRVHMEDIIYFESSQKRIIIHKVDGDDMFYGKLSEIAKRLHGFAFIYIHKSYLVHYNYIRQFEYDKIIMTNQIILPISQNNRKLVRKAQLDLRRGSGRDEY